MNKRDIEKMIPAAIESIKTAGISDKNDDVLKKWRSQISEFGAAIVMSNLKSAILFYSEQSGADVDRPKLLHAICLTLVNSRGCITAGQTLYDNLQGAALPVNKAKRALYDYSEQDPVKAKENIVNAARAVKLAFNIYNLVPDTAAQEEGEGQ